MKIIAFLTDPLTVRAILLHLDLPHRPPPLTPARAPPQAELELAFDQSPAFDLSEPEPVADFDFDQSLPERPPEWPQSQA